MILLNAELKGVRASVRIHGNQSLLLSMGLMTNLITTLCLCVILLNPVPRFWFDLVSENTGVQFDYDNQTHQGVVRELLRETFRGRK
jgi:hypothetical protein